MDNNNPNLNINELIPGEIYLYHYRFIARYPTGPSLNIHNQSFDTHEEWKWSLNIQEVTPEQRDWYAACVKAGKFVPKEEALKKTKFEVGRWYKCDNPNYIGKFEKFEESTNKFWTTEWITHGKYRKTVNNNQSWMKCTEIRKIPLEEIQQYLPEGHPDKIKKEFILPEKWCVKVTKENKYLLKNKYGDNFYYSNEDIYIYSFKINPDWKIPYEGGTKISGITEITFEQFKKYILKKDNYNHFKIGDIVEYIGTETNLSNDTKKDDLQLGYNYIVKSISKNNIELHGKLFYHDINLFKLATDKKFPLIEHPDWKIGDRVEIIDKGKQYSVYSEAFKKLNFKNKKQNRCDNGYKGKIFHVCFHPTQNDILIAINLNNGGQCLIGYKGIKKIDTSSNKVIEIVNDVPTFKSKEKHTIKPIQTQKLKAILIK